MRNKVANVSDKSSHFQSQFRPDRTSEDSSFIMSYYVSLVFFLSVLCLLPFSNRSLLLHDSSMPDSPKVFLPNIHGDPVKTVVSVYPCDFTSRVP